jgi:hypothetical protein
MYKDSREITQQLGTFTFVLFRDIAWLWNKLINEKNKDRR